jgi:hypothetical protein
MHSFTLFLLSTRDIKYRNRGVKKILYSPQKCVVALSVNKRTLTRSSIACHERRTLRQISNLYFSIGNRKIYLHMDK